MHERGDVAYGSFSKSTDILCREVCGLHNSVDFGEKILIYLLEKSKAVLQIKKKRESLSLIHLGKILKQSFQDVHSKSYFLLDPIQNFSSTQLLGEGSLDPESRWRYPSRSSQEYPVIWATAL